MERSPELEEVIVDWWHAFSRGDGSWFEGHVSRGAAVRLAGTDSNEWLAGRRVGEFLKGAVEALSGTLKISPGEPVAFREGNVGWGNARPTLTLRGGNEITFRWSAVFRRENGEWKAVQIHASVAIPDEELLGRTPWAARRPTS